MGKAKPGILGKRGARVEEGAGGARSAGKNSVKKARKGSQRSAQEAKDTHLPTAWRLASPLHQQCATIIGRLLQAQTSGSRGATVKGLCLAAHVQNKPAVYAVVCETLKYLPTLRKILQLTDFSSQHTEVSEAATYVMLYDLLVGQGVRAQGRAERAFLSCKEDFQALSQTFLDEARVATLAELLPQSEQSKGEAARPRTVRVNTLVTTVANVLAQLAKPPASWTGKHSAALEVTLDPHLPDLLLLPPGTDVHDHPLVEGGILIQQGKSSCMPAHALAAQPGWHVVDCCAAPGNKTTHVAASVGREGKVSAFEKDSKRAELLQRTLTRAGATHASVTITDFFEVDPLDAAYADVCAVVLDPSCSGSGTALSRLDFLLPSTQPADTPSTAAKSATGAAATGTAAQDGVPSADGGDSAAPAEGEGDKAAGDELKEFPGPTADTSARTLALAEFQKKILRHALRFPKLQRLAYSTCSVFRQENEDIVADVLPYAAKLGFKLATALPQWPRRGLQLAEYPWADKLVRVHPQLDQTDGFFVALFERDRA